MIKALEAAGLAKANRGKVKKWATTQLAQSFATATAAKRITRQTAEKALAQFMGPSRPIPRTFGDPPPVLWAIMKRNIVAGLGTP